MNSRLYSAANHAAVVEANILQWVGHVDLELIESSIIILAAESFELRSSLAHSLQ
jgi:hypothetical protein